MKDGREHIIDLSIDVPLREALRAMGCKGGRASSRVVTATERLLDEARPLLQPRGVYRICRVAGMTDTELGLEGWPSFHGPIASFLKPARYVAVGVVTVGNAIQEMAERKLRADEIFEGYALHAIGAAAADMASDAVAVYLREHEAGPDEDVTPPFSPGYCGLPLEAQRTLFSIVDGSLIGVTLRESCIMEPVKSVSGLIGIGPAEEIVERGVPCKWCELIDCSMRRE